MNKDKDGTDNDGFGSSFGNPMEYMESLAKMQIEFFQNIAPMMGQFAPQSNQPKPNHNNAKAPNDKGAENNNSTSPNFMGNNFMGVDFMSGALTGEGFLDQDPFAMQSKMMEAFKLPENGAGINGGDAVKTMLDTWSNIMNIEAWSAAANHPDRRADKRFKHEAWQNNPYYAFLRQQHIFLGHQAYAWLEKQDAMDERDKEHLKFQLDQLFDALSPSNFIFSNPEIMEKAIETKGASIQKGLQNAAQDMSKGQLTHTDPNAFELGVNIAVTPGKIVHETPMYQLIQYDPMTKDQLATPLVIFPPWINRYYILDLNTEKSFVKWALEQGISVFMVSWKSADSTMGDVIWDDYVKAEIDAIDTIRRGLDVDSVHAIGYCVAGTTLNAALALMYARGEESKVKSATFFTTQVDFEDAGDLKAFTTDAHVKLLDAASSKGYLDGRVMAMTFNMLRSKDLIWNYVVNNYLLGNDYPAFDLLHWNGDTTNLPGAWHKSYINDLYRENLLVIPNRLSVDGTPIDLKLIKTPAYIQAGIEDHIAPAKSVWKLRDHLSGPVRFTLAGSGHIAGVVNHPDAQKYQYWRNNADGLTSLDEFISGATETKGSWWPDWHQWLTEQDSDTVPAKDARIPGKGILPVIEDAPGRYVRMR